MAGYDGYRMSNNAVQAYEDGEMPLSQWKKRDIISGIEELVEDGELTLKCSFSELKKLPVEAMKDNCLYWSSWHHTGKFYNVTDFYSLNVSAIEKLTDDGLAQLALEHKEEQRALKKKKEDEVSEIWECEFWEWSGSRRHRKKEVFKEVGTIKGNWFIRPNKTKKKVTGNYFWKIRKLSEEEFKILKAKEEEKALREKKEKALREEEDRLRKRKEDLFKYQTKYKTLSGFMRSKSVDMDELEKVRKMMIDEKREWLRIVWEKKNYTRGLEMLDCDSFIENHINPNDFKFAGLNRKKESIQYTTMNRVSGDGKKIVVKVKNSHIIEIREGGYALILDATHVVFLEDWQISQSRYGTEVLLQKKFFRVKKWGNFEDFSDMPENLKYKTWLETAKLQDAAVDEAGVKLNRVKWR